MNGEGDTELLLVLLMSLLEPPFPPHASLLNALVDCNGDVNLAAQHIQRQIKGKINPTTQVSQKKRKLEESALDNWLLSSRASSSNKRLSENLGTRKEDPVPLLDRNGGISSKKPHSEGPSSSSTSKSLQRVSLKPCSVDSSNKKRKPVNLMSVLRDNGQQKPSITRNPPLMLSNPKMVSQHTPCTLHYSVLPPDLACELFYTMMDAAQGWSRNKWWLFDRLVESPHRTSFFARINNINGEGEQSEGDWGEAAQFWYNGRKTEPPIPFPPEMETACEYIEKVVNEELQKRPRFPLEWAGNSESDGQTWKANVAAANCYEGTKEGVGFHSDQLTYLGPYPTIASLSLGTTRIFRLREVIPSSEKEERHAQTFNIPLPHNSLVIMHASTQERFKHCVPPQPTLDTFHPPYPRRPIPGSSRKKDMEHPTNWSSGSNCRINITFRFYRPDFVPSTTPRCKCGVPCVLRPDMKGRTDNKDSHGGGSSDLSKSSGTRSNGKEAAPTGSLNADDYNIKYWWACYSGAQNEGKGCGMWKVMDAKAERRGPFIGDKH